MSVVLSTLTSAVIVDLYNLLVDADKQVKKFKDKATGVARLEALLAAENHEVFLITAEGEEPAEYDLRPIEIKAVPAKKATGGKRGPAPTYGDDKVISVLVTNPKRPGTPSWDRFARYKDGLTVGQFIAEGGRRGDIAWDLERKYINLA